MLVAGAGMVRMAMRDDGALRPCIGIDVEAPGSAIEALGIQGQPGVESVRSHFFPHVVQKSRFLASFSI
jgi:hypothetical protein